MVSGGRIRQILLLGVFLPWCWLMMMVVHEAGHVLAAWSTGATVERVVLHPLAISQTVVSENPQPLLVSWAGPFFGALFPGLVWLLIARRCWSITVFTRFFAGFCLIANGAYLGVGAWSGDGDAGDLIAVGAAAWQLQVFGVVACSVGLWLWHRLAPAMGMSHDRFPGWVSICMTTTLLMLTIVLELLCS